MVVWDFFHQQYLDWIKQKISPTSLSFQKKILPWPQQKHFMPASADRQPHPIQRKPQTIKQTSHVDVHPINPQRRLSGPKTCSMFLLDAQHLQIHGDWDPQHLSTSLAAQWWTNRYWVQQLPPSRVIPWNVARNSIGMLKIRAFKCEKPSICQNLQTHQVFRPKKQIWFLNM